MRKPSEIATEFSDRALLFQRTILFLVGIGGAGMSALARLARRQGYTVYGTDSTASPETGRLSAEGFDVVVGHSGNPLLELDANQTALILSDAIDLSTSPEVAVARERGIPIFRRSQLLGALLRKKKVVAVTGTHGKTTTSGMIGSALVAAGVDPLVVIGANIPAWNGPVLYGEGDWAVVEACEAYDALHDLDPTVVVLTNLELDHVDFHGSYENLRNSILRFVNRIPGDGRLFYCQEDRGAAEVAELSLVPKEGYVASQDLDNVELRQRGAHNVLNGSAALAVAWWMGLSTDDALRGIATFGGAERRQQVLRSGPPATIIDDYAHHPTEVSASLTAIRKGWVANGGRLIAVFQPHLYSRTEPLVGEFAEALSLADFVVLTDIYPARENPIPGVSSARIAEKLTVPNLYVPSRHLLAREVVGILRPGDVVVGMGAGNISEFGPDLARELDRGALRVAVLYGGDSAEREVSLHSGRAVFASLKRSGYDVDLLDLSDRLLGKGDLSGFTGIGRYDVAFLAVHGSRAEDGATQGLLEFLHIPYTGSGVQASAIAMDKAMTKRFLETAGIRVPRGVHLREVEYPFGFVPPLIIKPNAQGSTVGLTFVEEPGQVCSALANAFRYDREVLVEEWIKGIEISVPVLVGESLPPVEIVPTSGRYDFASKYELGATLEIIPARLPDWVLAQAQSIAVRAHQLLGCQGATRTDMIARPGEAGSYELFVLEVNTLPGMTPTSLLPNSAAAAGISFDELCARILKDALDRHGTRR